MRFRTVGITVAAMLLSLVVAAPASAALVLRIEDVGTGVGAVIFDNGAGDVNALTGALTFSGAVGAFAVNVTTGISKPLIGGTFAEMDLNSVNISVSGPGTLKMTLYDTDFSAASSQVQQLVGGTMTGGVTAVTFQTWANLNNLVPNVGPAQPVGAIGPLGGTPAGSTAACPAVTFTTQNSAFSNSCWSLFVGDNQYSLFTQATVTFAGAGTVSFDLNSQAAIPEPGSMLLLGSGLLGLAALARRRARKA